MGDENFINETHVKVGDIIMRADESTHEEREERFKKYEMLKQFEEEQAMLHAKNERERLELEMKAERHRIHKLHINKPMSLRQLQQVWHVQDHKNLSDFNATQFFRLHDINGDKLIDNQEMRLMLMTDLNEATKQRNQTILDVR